MGQGGSAAAAHTLGACALRVQAWPPLHLANALLTHLYVGRAQVFYGDSITSLCVQARGPCSLPLALCPCPAPFPPMRVAIACCLAGMLAPDSARMEFHGPCLPSPDLRQLCRIRVALWRCGRLDVGPHGHGWQHGGGADGERGQRGGGC